MSTDPVQPLDRLQSQFRLRDLMIAVAVIAGFFALFRLDNVLVWVITFGFFLSVGLISPYVVSRFRNRRRAALSGLIGTIVSALFSIAYVDVFVTGFMSSMFRLWILFLSVPLSIGFGITWAREATRGNATPRRNFCLVLLAILFVIPLPVILVVWRVPLQIAFFLSRPALDRLADRVADGRTIAWPVRAGMFQVVAAIVAPGNGAVGLVLDPNPNGKTGLSRNPPPYSHEHHHPYPSQPPFTNVNSDLALDSRWCYQDED